MTPRQPTGWRHRLRQGLWVGFHLQPPPGDGAEQVIRVNSGGAFPLGHPTTRLCLDLLGEALASRPVRSLLDLGCGAGVLGLAAAALGTPRVVALDIAPQAVRAAWANAQGNGLDDSLRVVQGSTECVRGPFDLVAANLPFEVQMELAAEVERLTAAAGRLILSGFRDNQEQMLRELYRKGGRSLQRRLVWDFRHPELPADLSFTWVAWLLG
ncbi:MAG: methyltransferase [Deltaproteobacteria bacterium]|nr:methyltransferase [Deltaproteobacteria bacterium]